MDYPDQDFTQLKYSDALAPIIQRGQFHLDPHIDFVSTWLYLVTFHHCIRNVDSPISKYSELLARYYGDIRYKGHIPIHFASCS